ncbi:MAG: hypothetical protein KJ072_20260 [Verrucomicrobia bacterium]|nr:hypothetical protein [Verrucomicrobiota bacterium]
MRSADGADQASVTPGNTDVEIGGLTISNAPPQAEVQALRDKAEELADDVRNLSTLIHSLRTALVAEGQSRPGSSQQYRRRTACVRGFRPSFTRCGWRGWRSG